uniref:Uncharacterized protein n=1 Tax=Chromera velia CCMP2878 TaxID=1169474 RepID=A0A0G4GUP8_9ALVE|eukprot:Cvel_23447.t1-p1 / transcript=Cvel_23447.t1 / gene=Cvel_23447 / organism=Chromera_velia_CCMP2878 / gene_product=hypothetical protein / transcript_product=hypothetical protein / location=Cvel_scaffold2417:17978-19595(+) / protein_length=258 / sequence_SO=supercontig / SO=protein_coding / is_pseudo=false
MAVVTRQASGVYALFLRFVVDTTKMLGITQAVVESGGNADGTSEAASGGEEGEGMSPSPLLARYLSETVTYPVLTIMTRVAVFDRGPGLAALSYWDCVRLSVRLDGLGSLFSGFVPYLLSLMLEDFAGRKSAEIGAKQKMAAQEISVLKLAVSTGLGLVTQPLWSLCIVQRACSNLKGLCRSETSAGDVMRSFAFRGLFVQTVLISSLLVLNLNLLRWARELEEEEQERGGGGGGGRRGRGWERDGAFRLKEESEWFE